MIPFRLILVMAIPGAALLGGARSVNRAACQPTTLVIVRHAEKQNDTHDAPLSRGGRERARTLAWTLRDVPFDAVYSTDLTRTRETVAKIAEKNGLTLSLYSPDTGQLARSIQGDHAGQTVLVCGHSDTIPRLLAELGAPVEEEILPGFDDLFMVSLNPSFGARMHRLHYPATR